jgi:hypothetical protein
MRYDKMIRYSVTAGSWVGTKAKQYVYIHSTTFMPITLYLPHMVACNVLVTMSSATACGTNVCCMRMTDVPARHNRVKPLKRVASFVIIISCGNKSGMVSCLYHINPHIIIQQSYPASKYHQRKHLLVSASSHICTILPDLTQPGVYLALLCTVYR